jgi:predicted amidohydrolase
MPRMIRCTTVQLPALLPGATVPEKKKQNIALIQEQLEAAGQASTDILLFAEYANLWHRGTSQRKRDYHAESLESAAAQLVSVYAKKYSMNIVFPMLTVIDGTAGNYCVLFNREGTIVGSYRKSHPTIAEQKLGMKRGNELPVFTLDCARIGIMTCMDIEYPEVAQALMVKGAEVLLFPHVQGSWGEIDWEIRYRARAIDTGLFLVSACYGYEEGDWVPGRMLGRSGVVGRDGTIIADLGRGIGTLTVDIDLDSKRVTHFFFEDKFDRTLAVCASRRPELYGALASTELRDASLETLHAEQRKR